MIKRKKKIITVVSWILLAGVVFVSISISLDAASPKVEIVSPGEDRVWVGLKPIEVRVQNIDPSDLRSVSIYLDGRLVKVFKSPPYTFKYNFGQKPKYRKLDVLVKIRAGVPGQSTLRYGIRSYFADDYQTVDVMQVVVPVVVTDKKGNYIGGLGKDDFIILEDGTAQDISYFSTSGSSSFHLVLLIDISSSMKDKINEVKAVARTFFRQLMQKDDEAIIVFFNHEVFEDNEFTGNIEDLDNSLSIAFPFGATALYDAIAYSVKLLKGIFGQNIIIIFSDGEDNSSTIDPYTLMKIVERSNSVIYSIGNQMDYDSHDQYRKLLEKISVSSGGMTFFFDDVSDLQKLYREIRLDIRAKYVLQFAPKNSKRQNRFRKITVRLTPGVELKYGKKLKIRTMKGYFY